MRVCRSASPLKREVALLCQRAKRVGIEPLIELLTPSLTLPLAGGGDAALLPLPLPTKRKRPWGAGVFVGPTWGTVGSSIIHEAIWGLVKRLVNSQKTLISPSMCSNWLRQPACLL